MSALMQGTTPSIEITISTEDFLLSNVTAMELYILNGRNLNTYDGDHASAPGMFELAQNNVNCRCELIFS